MLHCQSKGFRSLVLDYSCPNPSVSLQGCQNVCKMVEVRGYVLDSQPQLVLQSLDVLVRREVQSIEACVASWQLARIPVLFDGEPSWAVRALKVLETVDRYPRGSGGELEEAGFLLWGPRAKDLPEPGDDFVFSIITTVVGELGPIIPGKKKVSQSKKRVQNRGYIHVNVGHSADQEFQLPLVKDGDEALGNDLEETVGEGVELFLDATDDPIINGEIDVFVLVRFGHWYFGATGFEVDVDEFTEPIFGDGEGLFQDVGDVVLAGSIGEHQHR